jgi:hypothetical protein
MSKLSDVSNRNLRELLGTRTFKNATVTSVAATFAATSAPAGGIIYSIDGVIPAAKADVTVEPLTALPALQYPITGTNGFYTLPAGKTCYFVIVLDISGNYYTIQGTYAGQTFTAFKNILGTGDVPDIAVGGTYCPIAILKCVNATNPFIPATTSFAAAGVTLTVKNLSGALPSSNP